MVLPSGAFSSRTPGGSLMVIFSGRDGIVDATAHPDDVGRFHAVVVLEDRARPDAGRELILGQTHALALEVGRRLDAVVAHIDRVVAEGARHEGGHADIGAVAERGLDREARHRQFADIEVDRPEGAEEDLLRRQLHEHRIDPVDLNGAIEQRARPVIVTNRHG